MDQKKNQIHRITATITPETRAALAEIETQTGLNPGAVIRKFMQFHAAELHRYADQLQALPPGSPYRAALVGRVHTLEQHGSLGVQA